MWFFIIILTFSAYDSVSSNRQPIKITILNYFKLILYMSAGMIYNSQSIVFVVKHFTIVTSCNVATPNTINAVRLWFYNCMITWLWQQWGQTDLQPAEIIIPAQMKSEWLLNTERLAGQSGLRNVSSTLPAWYVLCHLWWELTAWTFEVRERIQMMFSSCYKEGQKFVGSCFHCIWKPYSSL